MANAGADDIRDRLLRCAALRKSGWNPDEPPYMFERLEAHDAVIGGMDQ